MFDGLCLADVGLQHAPLKWMRKVFVCLSPLGGARPRVYTIFGYVEPF